MRKVYLFMMVSLDGYFEGKGHDLGWHNVGGEFNEFAIRQVGETDTILLGRKTYQLFEDFWPAAEKDPKTAEDDRIIAKMLGDTAKVVFSKKLEATKWRNARISKDAPAEVAWLKREAGKDIAIFGSNNLCVSLIKAGLVDEFRIMVNPVSIGGGTLLFAGLDARLGLELVKTRAFNSGNVLLYYRPRQPDKGAKK
ncbi:MAG: dihydrofolate reductase family protein [Candidatus Micrarchaeota archaeon]